MSVEVEPVILEAGLSFSSIDSKPENDMEMLDAGTVEEHRDDEAMDDLFGDEDAEIVQHESHDSVQNEENETSAEDQLQNLTAEEIEHRRAMEYEEEEDNEPEEIHLREAAVSIPSIPKHQAPDGNHWVLRMPNFIRLDTRPFHPQTYTGPEQHDEEGVSSNARERSMSIKLQVENTIRWRWTKDANGNDIKQSNSRFVRWSDGSMTLLLGREQFEIRQTIDTSGTVPRQSVDGTTIKPEPETIDLHKPRVQGLSYLVAQHPRSTILQVEAPITGTLTMRPIGMQSETHQMLVRAVGQKHNKVARLRMAPDPIRDPEREKIELLKNQAKKPRKKRERDDGDLGTGAGRRRGPRRREVEQYWSDEEEEARDSGSDGDDDGATPRGKKASGKEKGTGEYQTDDFVVSDEDDDDDESEKSTPRKKKSKKSDGEADGKDALDEMEEKIEKQEAKRRKKRPTEVVKPQSDPTDDPAKDDEEEDVESEERDVEEEDEDEDDIRVRKAGTGARKKLVLEEEDE